MNPEGWLLRVKAGMSLTWADGIEWHGHKLELTSLMYD